MFLTGLKAPNTVRCCLHSHTASLLFYFTEIYLLSSVPYYASRNQHSYLVVPLSLHEEATRKLVNPKLNLLKPTPSVSACMPGASAGSWHPKEEFFCVRDRNHIKPVLLPPGRLR